MASQTSNCCEILRSSCVSSRKRSQVNICLGPKSTTNRSMLKGMILAMCDIAHCPPEWFRLRRQRFAYRPKKQATIL